MNKFNQNTCVKCSYPLYENVFDYSIKEFGFGLCRNCQDWIRSINKTTTIEAKKLFLALKQRNIPVEIEKFDGFKTVDIAIPTLKINIEVNGTHHNYDLKQARADLFRNNYSHKNGFLTIQIPNVLVNSCLDETADTITNMLITQREKILKTNPKYSFSSNEVFEELVFKFLVDFFHMFEHDWSNTLLSFKDAENNNSLFSNNDESSGVGNRRMLKHSFEGIINFMNDESMFDKYVDVSEDNILACIFLDRFRTNGLRL